MATPLEIAQAANDENLGQANRFGNGFGAKLLRGYDSAKEGLANFGSAAKKHLSERFSDEEIGALKGAGAGFLKSAMFDIPEQQTERLSRAISAINAPLLGQNTPSFANVKSAKPGQTMLDFALTGASYVQRNKELERQRQETLAKQEQEKAAAAQQQANFNRLMDMHSREITAKRDNEAYNNLAQFNKEANPYEQMFQQGNNQGISAQFNRGN